MLSGNVQGLRQFNSNSTSRSSKNRQSAQSRGSLSSSVQRRSFSVPTLSTRHDKNESRRSGRPSLPLPISKRSKTVAAPSNRSRSSITPTKQSLNGIKRAAQLRRKMHEISTELEELEPMNNISSTQTGYQIALNEAKKEAQQYKDMWSSAVREVETQRTLHKSLTDEIEKLNDQLLLQREELHRRTTLYRDTRGAAAASDKPAEIELVHVRAQAAQEKREKEAFRMKYEALLQQQHDISPARQSVSHHARASLKRIELEARCSTLEEMVKNHEKVRSQLILPNTIRTVLSLQDLSVEVQEKIMHEIHDYINEREKSPKKGGGGGGSSVNVSMMNSSGLSSPAVSVSVSPFRARTKAHLKTPPKNVFSNGHREH